MVRNVTSISLIHRLVKGADKTKREAGDYKNIEGDYERLPLLILGCFCLLAAKWQQGSHRWEHVVNFWQIGDKVSSLCDYWEIVDLAQNTSRMLAYTWPLFTVLSLTSEEGLEAVKKAAPCACKAFSNLVSLFEMLVDLKVLKGMNIHKWKVVGSIVGGLGYAHAIHKGWTEDTSQVGREVHRSVRENYRTHYQNQKFCNLAVLICIFAGKIIGFCSAVHALSAASRVLQFVSENKEDLFLTTYAAYTTAAIGLTFYDLKLRTLENQKGSTCQTN